MSRSILYIYVNVAFAALVAIGALIEPGSGVHSLYLILLFAVCASPFLSLRQLNGPHALLAVFCAQYFILYGALDFAHLFLPRVGAPRYPADAGPFLADYESLIVIGGLLAVVGYHVAGNLGTRAVASPPKDWSKRSLVLGGTVLWAITTWAAWKFNVDIISSATIDATRRGLSSLSGIQIIGFILANYLQPLSIVILAYTQCKYRQRSLLMLLIGALVISTIFGFVANIKGQALIGWVLFALTKFLMDGKIPRSRLVLAGVLIILIFPILQTHRVLQGDVAHAQVAQNVIQEIKDAIAGSGKVTSGRDRPETFLERWSVKGSVQMIVSRTGNNVQFQHGYTLIPLFAVLIPRVIWPDKPDVQTGQLLNQKFGLSDQPDTYISPSHLGELYWNFGWAGVLVGMPIIGLLLGFVGRRCDLSTAPTLTPILVLIATIQLLVIGFESSIAALYSEWIRSMLAIGLLHWMLARSPVPFDGKPARSVTEAGALSDSPFPNLMR